MHSLVNSVTVVFLFMLQCQLSFGQDDHQNFVEPVLDHTLELDEKAFQSLWSSTKAIMQMTDEQILANIPEQTPRIHNGCPSCRAGKTDASPFDQPQPPAFHVLHREQFEDIYNPLKPGQYSCPVCMEKFPHNPRFPMSYEEVLQNPQGEDVVIRHFLDPEGILINPKAGQVDRSKINPVPRKYYLGGVLDTTRHYWSSRQMYDLALLYRLTGDAEVGRKALLMLNGYADRFPHWLLATDYGHRYVNCMGRKPPYGWIETREGRRSRGELNGSAKFMETTDLLYGTPAMKRFSQNSGEDLMQKLWENVIRLTMHRVLAQPNRGITEFGQTCPGMAFKNIIGVFRRPELFHSTVSWGLNKGPSMVWGADGGFVQGTGYGQIQLLAMSQMRELNGYSDPADYSPPAGTNRVQDFRHPVEPHEHFYMKAYNFLADIRMPDGGLPIYNDSQHKPFLTWIPGLSTPLERSKNVMKSGLKYAILGDGIGDEQVQVHLNFGSNAVNHGHADTLALQIYAFGHYLIDDYSYAIHRARKYVSSTLGHNTVVVDHQNQLMPFSDGSFVSYESRFPGISLLSVDASRVYAPDVTKYNRTLILNTTELDRPYVIDIFQVAGGRVHDYLLRSSEYHEETADISLPMTKMPGLTPLLPEGESITKGEVGSGYRMFFDVRKGPASQYFTLDYAVKNPWLPAKPKGFKPPKGPELSPYKSSELSWPDNPPVGTRHHFPEDSDYDSYLFGSINSAETTRQKRADSDFHEWDRTPHFMMRSEVQSGDESMFVVIHEPWVNAPQIRSVVTLPTFAENLLVLEVQFDDRKDTLFLSTDGSPVKESIGDTRFCGRFGFLIEKGNKTDSYLFGGTILENKKRNVDLTIDQSDISGVVKRSYRKWNGDDFDGFAVTGDDLPFQDDLAGAFVILSNSGDIADMKPGKFPKEGPRFYLEMASEFAGLKEGSLKMEEFQEAVKHLSKTGAGWGAVIDRVEKRGEDLIIYTKDDHGLDIVADRCSEYFFPQRRFDSPTQFIIYPAVSNQGKVEVTPKSGSYMEPIAVRCQPGNSNHHVYYAIREMGDRFEPIWARYGKPLPLNHNKILEAAPTESWKKYETPVRIDKNCKLLIKRIDPNGIKEPLYEEHHYIFPPTPDSIEEEQLALGVTRTIYQGRPQEAKLITQKNVFTIDSEEFVRDYIVGKNMRGYEKFEGFIKIEIPGVYRIYFRPDRDGLLSIGGQTCVPETNRGAAIMPYVFEIPLRTGFYPIEVVHSVQGEGRSTPKLEIEWVPPNARRSEIPASVLFHLAQKGNFGSSRVK